MYTFRMDWMDWRAHNDEEDHGNAVHPRCQIPSQIAAQRHGHRHGGDPCGMGSACGEGGGNSSSCHPWRSGVRGNAGAERTTAEGECVTC
mmetsp:Transcript_25037/g.70769  ORF Transcript_25037/g.70769 Transcript_25037/m.70769 type:complete len:90 (+) Transcript_25037:339-608(+)